MAEKLRIPIAVGVGLGALAFIVYAETQQMGLSGAVMAWLGSMVGGAFGYLYPTQGPKPT